MQMRSLTGTLGCRALQPDSKGVSLIACRTSDDFMGHACCVWTGADALYIVYIVNQDCS